LAVKGQDRLSDTGMEIRPRPATEKFDVTREERNVLVFLAVGLVLGSWPRNGQDGAAGGTEEPDARAAETEVVDLFPIDLNAASAELLAELPGIGPSKAQAIVARRESDGPYRTVDDLAEVRGIGPKTVDRLRQLVIVDAPARAGNRERHQLGERPTRNSPGGERDRLDDAARAGAEPAQVER
jgi:competence protein ComEA